MTEIWETLSSLCEGRDENCPLPNPNPDAMWSKSELASLATSKGAAWSIEQSEATPVR